MFSVQCYLPCSLCPVLHTIFATASVATPAVSCLANLLTYIFVFVYTIFVYKETYIKMSFNSKQNLVVTVKKNIFKSDFFQ